MVIKLPRSRESTPVAVTPPSTTLDFKVKLQRKTCRGAASGLKCPAKVSGLVPGAWYDLDPEIMHKIGNFRVRLFPSHTM